MCDLQELTFTYSQSHTELIIDALKNLKGVFYYGIGSEFKEKLIEVKL